MNALTTAIPTIIPAPSLSDSAKSITASKSNIYMNLSLNDFIKNSSQLFFSFFTTMFGPFFSYLFSYSFCVSPSSFVLYSFSISSLFLFDVSVYFSSNSLSVFFICFTFFLISNNCIICITFLFWLCFYFFTVVLYHFFEIFKVFFGVKICF